MLPNGKYIEPNIKLLYLWGLEGQAKPHKTCKVHGFYGDLYGLMIPYIPNAVVSN